MSQRKDSAASSSDHAAGSVHVEWIARRRSLEVVVSNASLHRLAPGCWVLRRCHRFIHSSSTSSRTVIDDAATSSRSSNASSGTLADSSENWSRRTDGRTNGGCVACRSLSLLSWKSTKRSLTRPCVRSRLDMKEIFHSLIHSLRLGSVLPQRNDRQTM